MTKLTSVTDFVSLFFLSVTMVSPCAPNDKSYKITNRANEYFEKGLYSDAIAEYTKALKLVTEPCDDDYLALIYTNRSASYLQLNEYENAKEDASRAMAISRHWAKVFKV